MFCSSWIRVQSSCQDRTNPHPHPMPPQHIHPLAWPMCLQLPSQFTTAATSLAGQTNSKPSPAMPVPGAGSPQGSFNLSFCFIWRIANLPFQMMTCFLGRKESSLFVLLYCVGDSGCVWRSYVWARVGGGSYVNHLGWGFLEINDSLQNKICACTVCVSPSPLCPSLLHTLHRTEPPPTPPHR